MLLNHVGGRRLDENFESEAPLSGTPRISGPSNFSQCDMNELAWDVVHVPEESLTLGNTLLRLLAIVLVAAWLEGDRVSSGASSTADLIENIHDKTAAILRC